MHLHVWSLIGVLDTELNTVKEWATRFAALGKISRQDEKHIKSYVTRPPAITACVSLLAQREVVGLKSPIMREHGVKPRFPGSFWNTSHHGSTLVIAHGNEEVGVDVMELTVPMRHNGSIKSLWNAIRNQFSDNEMIWMESVKENEIEARKRFYYLWTAKEAYLKYTGTGIVADLNSIEISTPSSIPPESPGSVIDKGVVASVELHHLQLNNSLICICMVKSAAATSRNFIIHHHSVEDLIKDE